MDLKAFFTSEFNEHTSVTEHTLDQVQKPFEAMVNTCVEAIQNQGKIVFFGNGGSAADAQHLATELTVRYVQARPPLAAIALTTDTSTLTAVANDYGYEDVFARQILALCNNKDVIIGISTSGNSANVIKGLKQARDLGCVCIGFTGAEGGELAAQQLADTLICVPSKNTPRIQEMHILIGHLLCAALEQELGLL